MPTVRPFCYNLHTNPSISGTEQVGDIAAVIGNATIDPSLQWWNGPDEDLGYVICYVDPTGNHPNAPERVLGTNYVCNLGFLRTSTKSNSEFVELAKKVTGNNSLVTAPQAKTELNNQGYWTSYSEIVVVTTGLVLNLDAGNLTSYSGSGTTWYDLSGNSNDVTMQNSGSITWTDGGIGYFTTGPNGWFSKTSGTNIPVGSSLYTFSAWIKLGTSWSGQGIMSVGPFGIGNQANALRTGSTNQLINYWWGNDFVVNSSLSPTDAWFNIVARDNGTDRSIWINGVSIGTGPRNSHNVTTSDIQVAKTAGSEYLQGNISQVLIYNTSLSNSDILANFNATKSKFGY
jgi:hypothetical protein